jgi:hypothetical protein
MGFAISLAPQQLRDSGRWTMYVYFAKHRAEGVKEVNFTADNAFQTKEAAAQHCVAFGKGIIDGESATCVVDDL